jgi:hypothetical protein
LASEAGRAPCTVRVRMPYCFSICEVSVAVLTRRRISSVAAETVMGFSFLNL